MLICQLFVDSQAATFSHVSTGAALAVPAPMSGRAMPAPPAVTVSDARLMRLGWYLRWRPVAAMVSAPPLAGKDVWDTSQSVNLGQSHVQ
ncbi:hypothetical protein GCM10011583_35830 [Streptomyces camponoticapitis]|uniref:Uncharacterized protein n=1 Tax=Streptomyces camponoticapitis TaxID=1616125 RepID=A0ABQ2EA24_9ACTN|nr:hypothetical protein GCM10011583_35830 [Streptomyces camponoticapitis]